MAVNLISPRQLQQQHGRETLLLINYFKGVATLELKGASGVEALSHAAVGIACE